VSVGMCRDGPVGRLLHRALRGIRRPSGASLHSPHRSPSILDAPAGRLYTLLTDRPSMQDAPAGRLYICLISLFYSEYLCERLRSQAARVGPQLNGEQFEIALRR
jgi:hypothetical protein